jgi:hypothetical protein
MKRSRLSKSEKAAEIFGQAPGFVARFCAVVFDGGHMVMEIREDI